MYSLRFFYFVFTLLISLNSFSQYRERFNEYNHLFLQQSDSIYKKKKVKSRVLNFTGYNSLSFKNKMSFDKEGKLIAFQFPADGYFFLTTEFLYDATNSKLLSVQDVFTKTKESKFYQNFVKGDAELESKFNALPEKEVVKYDLQYKEGVIEKIIRKSEKAKIFTVSEYSNEGLKYKFTDNDQYPVNFDCEFFKAKNYQFLPAKFTFQKSDEETIRSIEYVYDSKHQFIEKLIVKESGHYKMGGKLYKKDEEIKEFILEYKNGLLTTISNNYYTYELVYEFY